jgi:hypothetical protein
MRRHVVIEAPLFAGPAKRTRWRKVSASWVARRSASLSWGSYKEESSWDCSASAWPGLHPPAPPLLLPLLLLLGSAGLPRRSLQSRARACVKKRMVGREPSTVPFEELTCSKRSTAYSQSIV